jgi:XRE family transcriptional regulator, regulator of sulfur utilization
MREPRAMIQTTKNPELAAAFGKTLRALRLQRGFTQEQFAYASAIDRAYMSRLESGRVHPSLDIVFRVSSTLGMPPSEVVGAIAAAYEAGTK